MIQGSALSSASSTSSFDSVSTVTSDQVSGDPLEALFANLLDAGALDDAATPQDLRAVFDAAVSETVNAEGMNDNASQSKEDMAFVLTDMLALLRQNAEIEENVKGGDNSDGALPLQVLSVMSRGDNSEQDVCEGTLKERATGVDVLAGRMAVVPPVAQDVLAKHEDVDVVEDDKGFFEDAFYDDVTENTDALSSVWEEAAVDVEQGVPSFDFSVDRGEVDAGFVPRVLDSSAASTAHVIDHSRDGFVNSAPEVDMNVPVRPVAQALANADSLAREGSVDVGGAPLLSVAASVDASSRFAAGDRFGRFLSDEDAPDEEDDLTTRFDTDADNDNAAMMTKQETTSLTNTQQLMRMTSAPQTNSSSFAALGGGQNQHGPLPDAAADDALKGIADAINSASEGADVESASVKDSGGSSVVSTGSTAGAFSLADGTRVAGSSSFAAALSFAKRENTSSLSRADATEQVIVRLRQGLKDGQNSMSIQLHPRELGAIAVRLSFGASGQVRGSVTSDNVETLEILKKDAEMLVQALQDAGIDVEAGSLDFSLGDQNSNAGQTAYVQDDADTVRSVDGDGTKGASPLNEKDDVNDTEVVSETYYVTPNSVNIRV